MSFFYEVAIIGAKAPNFTYKSDERAAIGAVAEVKLKNKSVLAVVLKESEKPNFRCLPLLETPLFFPSVYLDIAKFISAYYICTLGETLALFEPFRKNAPESAAWDGGCGVVLSKKQHEAYSFVKANQTSLLFGDTGSGKTEIYIKLIEDELREGKSAIMLMPEISLTPQMEKRLKKEFGESVAIWHSKVTKAKKAKILEAIRNGEIKIIAGARSALFLPLANIGIIVVDEEHDDSYKSQSAPRYHARDMSVYMGMRLGARVVLGSATPSCTSYRKYPFFRLKGGYFESQTEIVYEKEICSLTPLVKLEIKKRLEIGEQVIVFLPTRGNFKYQICLNCGKSIECPFCSVSMSMHKNQNSIRCHYCGYSEAIPNSCPHCGGGSFALERQGTAEIVELLRLEFPEAKIAKFDRDEISSESALKKRLEEFNSKEVDILVGTQMLSKGHDYHDVTLAVVLGIDYLLYQADFRARERAVSLLLQIVGRSGRKKRGAAIIQTLNMEFFKKFMDDYELFLKDELKSREPNYPPFSRFAMINIANSDKQKAEIDTKNTIEAIGNDKNIEIVGHGISPIEKLGGKYRFHLFLRTKNAKDFSILAHKIDTHMCDVDIDPINFS